MTTEKMRFVKTLELLIKKYEPLHSELMDFEGLLSNKPYHEWAKGIDISESVIEFSKELDNEVKRCSLPRFEAKDIFRSTMSVYKKGPWVRSTTDKRLDIREIRRPECVGFHILHGPIPPHMKDSMRSNCRSNPRQVLSGSHFKRKPSRNPEREECRRFHAQYGPIPQSLLDNSGPKCRSGAGVPLADFFGISPRGN